MASFGRLTAAVLGGTVDTTVALANINFDFSVLKVEAPREFHELGNSLSPPRRKEAEAGSVHTTARKLGAIFEPLLPSTPELDRAYGLRASEIAKASTLSPLKDHGIFKNQAGIDGTSIWAAATSGPEAIKVHLLACMLARIWERSEAISIWVEVLESRKQEIEIHLDKVGSLDIKTYMAARQEVSRTQLAEWDSSARAWLRVADSVMGHQQKQLLLIIGNLKKYVNSKPGLYGSVVHAWKAGIEGMERLLKGSPQQMQSGELLLGLSAWHLYPDLNVLDAATTIVRLHDPLVPESGILTIGLQMDNTSKLTGLHWSLPLAHLRYYGDPVPCTRSIAAEGSRLSLNEFHQAVLGCILGGWEIADADLNSAVQWIVDLSMLITRFTTEEGLACSNSWLDLLSITALAYIKSTGIERRIYTQLVNLGRKYFNFIGKPKYPFFGLSETERFLQLAKGQENKIRALRKLSNITHVREKDVIIRYISDLSGKEEFTTALPRYRAVSKRTSSSTEKNYSEHIRWVHSKPLAGVTHDTPSEPSTIRRDVFLGHKPKKGSTTDPKTPPTPSSDPDEFAQTQTSFLLQKKRYEALEETVLMVEDEPFVTLSGPNAWDIRILRDKSDDGYGLSHFEPWYGEINHFEHWCGDPNSAALFIRMKQATPRLPEYMDISELQTCFVEDNLDTTNFLDIVCEAMKSLGSSYLQSLKAITAIDSLYKTALRSTIDVRVFQNPLREAQWLRYAHKTSSEGDGNHKRGVNETRVFHTQLDNDKSDSHKKTTLSTADRQSHGNTTIGLATNNTILDVDDRESRENYQQFFQEAMDSDATDDAERTKSSSRSWSIKHSVADLAKELNRVFQPIVMEQERAFSCILIFESGQFNIAPEQLRNVMAISSGDSLFIAAPLLSDPARSLRHSEIHHVMGNIGRAGIALLAPPMVPRIKSAGIEHWNLVNRDRWQGLPQDCFQDTSLHLWFTGSSLPVDVGYSGAQDTELYILESVISVHGKGEWIADLDVLKALRHSSLLFRPFKATIDTVCHSLSTLSQPSMSTCDAGHPVAYQQERWSLIALENWMEFLEHPSEDSILLARGNWQARLAATAICIAQGRPVYVLTDHVCWVCIEIEVAAIRNEMKSAMVRGLLQIPITFIG